MAISKAQLRAKNALYLRSKHRSNTKAKLNSSLPRAIISRSSKHISLQVIDANWTSLFQVKDFWLSWTKTERATQLWSVVAKWLTEKGFSSVVFDRNGYRYHGRVAAVAQAMRDGGLVL